MKIWTSGKHLVYIEYFLLLSVQAQLGVTQCISDFRPPCISEMASHRAERTKFGPQGWVFSVY